MLAIAIPAGLLIGLSLGALGGGGSILTVPALVYLLHQPPHTATTGSLLIVGITALAGMTAHLRAGRVRVAQGVTFGVLGVAGSYAGTRLSANIKPGLLLALFAVLMLVAAAAMLPPPTSRHELSRPGRPARSGPGHAASGRAGRLGRQPFWGERRQSRWTGPPTRPDRKSRPPGGSACAPPRKPV